MSNWFETEITLDEKGKTREVKNPVLFRKHNNEPIEMTVLVEYWPSKEELRGLQSFIDKHSNRKNYQILSCFGFMLSKKEQVELGSEDDIGDRKSKKDGKKQVIQFYQTESIDLKKYVPKNTVILPIEKAIYTISDSLRTEYFFDTILGLTYFWDPKTECWCYPINSILDTVGKDTFERNFTAGQFAKASQKQKFSSREIKDKIVEVKNPNEWLRSTYGEAIVAVDTETTGLDFMTHHIFCMTVSFDGHAGYYLDYHNIDLDILNEWFKGKKLVMANGKFDLKMLWKSGIKKENTFLYHDTMNSHHVINGMQGHSLKTQAWLFDRCGGYELELEEYMRKYKIKSYDKVQKSIMVDYATKDTIVTFRMYKLFDKLMEDLENKTVKTHMSCSDLYYNVIMPAVRMFADIEYEGTYVNLDKLREVESSVLKQIEEAEREVRKFKGFESINISSDVQLGKKLQELRWEDLGISKKGCYLTGEDNLVEWIKLGHPEAQALMNHRKKAALYRTYVGNEKQKSGMWQYIREHSDGSFRVHSSFYVMMAHSTRLTSSDPNLQNIPAHGESSKIIKQIFCTPSSDHVFVSADMAGLQLRIAGIDSKEETMKDIFINHGGDIHSRVAVAALLNDKVSLEEFLKNKNQEPFHSIRSKAKEISFLLLFGGSIGLLYKSIILPLWKDSEVDEFIKDNNLKIELYKDKLNKKYTVAKFIHEKFFTTYPNLLKWVDKNTTFAQKHGYFKSTYGHVRRTPYLKYIGRDDGTHRSSNYQNISLNSPVQNEETVIMQRAARKFYDWCKQENVDARIFNMIHDAIEVYSHKKDLERVCKKLREVFEEQYEEYWGIPFELEGNVADYTNGELWDMGHKWDKYLV